MKTNIYFNHRSTKYPGLLISFDGIDSSGKETQAKTLAQKLSSLGHQVGCFATPDYTTPTGQKLKTLFQGINGSWDDLSWQEQMELIATNRAEHKKEVIDILTNKGIVIYDRYVPSSMAHITVDALKDNEMESKREEIMLQVQQHEYEHNQMPKEGLSLFLDMPPQVASNLLNSRKEELAEEDETTDEVVLQKRIYQQYQWLTTTYPDHYQTIPCLHQNQLKKPDEIAEQIWQTVTAKFPQLKQQP